MYLRTSLFSPPFYSLSFSSLLRSVVTSPPPHEVFIFANLQEMTPIFRILLFHYIFLWLQLSIGEGGISVLQIPSGLILGPLSTLHATRECTRPSVILVGKGRRACRSESRALEKPVSLVHSQFPGFYSLNY